MAIRSITFVRSIEVGGRALDHWSATTHKNIRVTETPHGIELRTGRFEGSDNWVPSGLVACVPWVGVVFVLKEDDAQPVAGVAAGEPAEPAQPSPEPAQPRGRVRA